MPANELPLVTTILLTNNHERYLKTAVRSVLGQQVDFAHEIVVGEDCSRDRTRAILDRLACEFPGRMQVVRRDHNLGLSANLEECFQRARGKYIAVLEGDDFWSSPLKLAKVTAAIEAHRVREGWMPSPESKACDGSALGGHGSPDWRHDQRQHLQRAQETPMNRRLRTLRSVSLCL